MTDVACFKIAVFGENFFRHFLVFEISFENGRTFNGNFTVFLNFYIKIFKHMSHGADFDFTETVHRNYRRGFC